MRTAAWAVTDPTLSAAAETTPEARPTVRGSGDPHRTRLTASSPTHNTQPASLKTVDALVDGLERATLLPTHSAGERRLEGADSPATTSTPIDYCSRVAVRVAQTWASTLPAASTTTEVSELANALPAALSRIVVETLSNVPSGVPSGAPNGV